MTLFHRTLILGCSTLALAGCGADEISSPGTGGDVIITNPPAPTPTPTPPPTSTLVTPATGCPTIADPQQLTDDATITGPTGEYRVCTLPARFNTSSTLPFVEGLLYRMNGRVDVGTDGGATPTDADTDVTLTIAPGAIVYASGSSFLMVNRGNKINATGTASRPIVFTSRDNVLGLNTDDSSGQWGGVVLAGRAQITDCLNGNAASAGTVNCERQVEGAVQPARFGGVTNDDNSGTISYVQIRYSGFVLSGDAELQSLTTGGTGTGTTFNNIMSFNSSDDGVEFFGGFVNAKNLIVVGAEDDMLDTDTGAKTNLQYVIAVQRANAGDTIIEADSTNVFADSLPRQNTQISNATFIHRNSASNPAIRIRGGADYTIVNSVLVAESNSACLRIDDTETYRPANAGLQDLGAPRFNSLGFDCATPFRSGSVGNTTLPASDAEAVFNAGTNNRTRTTATPYTNTLTMTFINGANETAYPVFDPTALSSFFDAVTYVGAVENAADNWYAGWTCNSVTVSFGTNIGDCTSLPVY